MSRWGGPLARLEQIPESLLARLWKERASREKSFRAGDGRRFRVIYPGRVGTSAGPDFRDAVLEQEGLGLVRGDVEVHVRQRDWDAHGHGKDPRYNGVVLHVVGGTDGTVTTLHSGSRVPVVSMVHLLEDRPATGAGFSLWTLLKPHGYLPPGDGPEMGALLDGAGDSRFLEKSSAFLASMKSEDAQQVLYSALMEALGYSQNRHAFLELAYIMPYRLLEEAALESPAEERTGTIQGLLLNAAGLMPSPPPGATRVHGGPVAGRVRPKRHPGWYLFRVRPQNHPRLRIMAFAHVLEPFLPSAENDAPASDGRRDPSSRPPAPATPATMECSEGGIPGWAPGWARMGLVEGMTRLVRERSNSALVRDRWSGLERELMGSYVPLPWRSGGGDWQKRGAPMGQGRARDMAVNCVLPFLHSHAQLKGDAALETMALDLFHLCPRLQENEITREMRQQLFSHVGAPGAAHPRRRDARSQGEEVMCNARRQQGLLHLHRLITSPAKSP